MKIMQKYVKPFNIYCYENNKYTFLHIDIANKEIFYSNLFDYFFDENKLIQYIENQKGIHFNPSRTQYITLYKHLKNYIDIENIEITISMPDCQEFIQTLSEETTIQNENKNLKVRLDKFGKIGEYFFSIILSIFFKFDCIIPKVHYITDNNMNVYGIDTLFYSNQDNLLLFGESKFCINLQNGINLINESLKQYEQQIEEDFRLILSGGFKNQCNKVFNKKFGTIRDISLTMKDFIEKANIEKIGIPIFITHGTETDEKYILKKLNNIKKYLFFDIDTTYYYISLPIIDKEELIKVFIKKINSKLEYYSNEAKK